MNKLGLVGLSLIAFAAFGCQIVPPSSTKTTTPAAQEEESNKTKSDSDSDSALGDGNGDSTDGDTTDPTDDENSNGGGGGGGGTAGPYTDIHWENSSCSGGTCWDMLLNSDGTYQRQGITINVGGNPLLRCEHGTWSEASSSSIDFVPACAGRASYSAEFSQQGDVFRIQNVSYKANNQSVFNCSPTECK